MHLLSLVFVLILTGCGQPAMESNSGLTLKRAIPLPGVAGRIDHLAYDYETDRLFVAALGNGSLEVIDLAKGERIKSISGLKEPQGAAVIPGTKEVVVACGGDGTVRAYDTSTCEERGKTDVGDDADNIRLGPDGNSALVGYGSGALAILDAISLKKSGEAKLSGHPESFQVEPGTHRAFVNVPGGFVGGGGCVAVVDLQAQKVTAEWKLEDAGRNFPMALDSQHHRLFVGCRRLAKLVVLDTDTGKAVSSPSCVGDADDVFVDSKSEQILVVGGDGEVDIFATKDQQVYTKVGSVKTGSGARTGLFVPERRSLFVAVPAQGKTAAEIREYTVSDAIRP